MKTIYKHKFWITGLQCAIIAITTLACNIGMGDIVDLEAPAITITSPESLSYVGKRFAITGTCADNVKVTAIEVQTIPQSTTLRYEVAMKGNEEWIANVELEEEGEYTFRVIAIDQNRNTSVNSVKQITLLADFDPPTFKNIEIDRGGGNAASLLPVDGEGGLEALNAGEYADIDYFQNESFKIKADLVENMGIQDNAELELYDEAENLFLSKRRTGGSLFAPEWEITASDINAAAADKSITINPAERHYFKVKIKSADDAGNAPRENEYWYLCWYPNADKPRISSDFENGGGIVTAKDSMIPVHIFDDDNLDKIYYKIYGVSEWNGLPGGDDDAKFASLRETAIASFTEYSPAGGQEIGRETTSMTVTSPSENGDFRIAVFAKDKKASGAEAVWSHRAFRLTVTDDTVPIIMVEYPAENETPPLRAGENSSLFLDIKGYSIDKAGTTKVLLAYVSSGKSMKDVEDALEKAAVQSGGGGGTPEPVDGVKIWRATLSDETDEPIGGSSYKKRSFEFAVKSTDIDNAPRRFVLYAENASSGKTFKNFNVLGNKQGPSIKIEYKDAVGYWWDMADVHVHTHDKGRDLDLRITVTPTAPISALSVTEGARPVALHQNEEPADIPQDIPAGAVVKFVVDDVSVFQNDAEGATRIYEFRVEDTLGNVTRAQKTVIISTMPLLERITSDMSNRTFAAGETITIRAVFSAPVKISGAMAAPRAALFYGESDLTPKYAEYRKGAGSASLEFEFTVPPGAKSDRLLTKDSLLLENERSITPLDSDTPVRVSALVNERHLQGQKEFKLDGVAPRVTSVSAGSREEWYKEGNVIEIGVTIDKSVLVGGSPKLRLSTSGSPQAIDASFVRIEPAGGGTVLVFSYRVSGGFTAPGFPQRTDAWNNNVTLRYNAILDADVVTDMAGNALDPQFADGSDLKNSGGTPIRIDTTSPGALSLKVGGARAAGSYGASTMFAVDGGEPGATIEYTITSGSQWADYSAPFMVSTTSGDIYARQKDAAGNYSGPSNPSKVTIASGAPFLAAITCDIPDGTYPRGETLPFKLTFVSSAGGKVHTNGATGPTITIEGGSAGDTKNVVVPVTPIPTNAPDSSLYFYYTIPEGVVMNPVKITDINLAGVKSGGGLADPTYNQTDGDRLFIRPGVKILATTPQIAGYAPAKGGGGILGADGTIRLTFDREMWPESGTITIEPNYGATTWVAPPVLSSEDFEKVFSALSPATKQAIMQTDPETSINPKLDAITGRPLGPYLKTTHGLNMTGANATPDLTTKYVLKFDAQLAGTSVEAQNFRKAFKAAGYHKQVIEVTSPAVTGAGANTIVITPPEPLPNGRNWQLYMDAGAFRDAAGNLSGEIKGSASTDTSTAEYTFWSDKVAAPVIRVDRVSTNDVNVAVIDADVRIDTETPDATIMYGTSEARVVTANQNAIYPTVQTEDNPDIVISILTAINPATPYLSPSIITIGDHDLYTARKDYVAAKAVKTGFTDSEVEYEGVFKSLIVYRLETYRTINESSEKKMLGNADESNYLKLEGATIANASSSIAGFPLKNNDMTGRYSLYMRKKTSLVDKYVDFVWISYEITSEWYQCAVVVSNKTLIEDGKPTFSHVNSGYTGSDWETGQHFKRTYGTYGLNTTWEQPLQ
ncbi:MAG: hypothetical protein LBH85_03900 [Treponema sp.]|jgi:hypothetical protein|nr:hypothetical protein [Treponema sp.]